MSGYAGLVSRARTGALVIVLSCFVASALVRSLGAAPVLAEQMAGLATEPTSALIGCEPPEDTQGLLEAIRERDSQLDAEAERIAERLQILALAEERFEAQRVALVAAEEKLAATLAIADEAAERDIAQLTAVYANMKPKQAAEIFDAMDISFAAGFLIRMEPQAAANILSAMDADLAYSVSLIMASRNAGAPTE